MDKLQKLEEKMEKMDDKAKALKNAIKEEKKKRRAKERKALNHLKLKFAEEYYYYQKLKAENEGNQPPSYEELYEKAKKWSKKQEKIRDGEIEPDNKAQEQKTTQEPKPVHLVNVEGFLSNND